MGFLYDSVMEQKRKYLIQELQRMNVTQSSEGKDLNDLSYDDLKYEVVIASFRQIEIDNPEHKFF